MPNKPVLVGTDGSTPAHRALEWAIAFGKAIDRPLRIVCSYGLPSFVSGALDGGYAVADDAAVRQGAGEVLAEAHAIATRAGIEHTVEAAPGDPSAVLVELSAQASVCVVGTRGGGGFTDRFLGSVSAALPAHGHCPTVIVPYRAASRVGGVPVRGDMAAEPLRGLHNIVVGVDGSEASAYALEMAFKLAARTGGSVRAVSAVSLGLNPAMLAAMPPLADDEVRFAEVQQGLDQLLEPLRAEFGQVDVVAEVAPGNPAEVLIEKSLTADLIAVGSRGRGGFAGLILGSTSQAVLHHSLCPVAVLTRRTAPTDLD